MIRYDYTGKRVLVTGASRGMGRAVAVGFAEAGATVFGIGRGEEPDFARALREKGRSFRYLSCDLSEETALREIAKRVSDEADGIDILINNAGIIVVKPAEAHTEEDLRHTFRVNVTAPFLLSQLFGEGMRARRYGRIVNISSIHGLGGGFDCVAYTMSKHAVIGMTRALANEWGSFGLTVNAVAPGFTVTDNTKGLRENRALTEEITERIPLRRWAEPEDIAGVVLFLASDAASYVNGEVLTADGGLRNV